MKIWDARELWTVQFPAPRWAVPSLIPEGLTILAGAPKIGKSWMALGIALGLAHGGKLLGKYDVPAPATVLYLALEDPPRRLQERLHQLSDRPPDRLYLATQWRQGAEGCEDLAGFLTAHSDTHLVIVDTWQKFRGASGRRQENIYVDDYEAVSRLKEVADRFSIAIVVLHHLRKFRIEDGDFIEDVLGSMGIPGAADTVIVVRRTRGRMDAELRVTGRDVEEQELALIWDDRAGWQIAGDAAEYHLSEQRANILQALRESEECPMSPKAICTALGIDPKGKEANSVRQLLGKLVDEGAIRRLNYGEYGACGTRSHCSQCSHFQIQGVLGGEL
jgi:hypothetical protein